MTLQWTELATISDQGRLTSATATETRTPQVEFTGREVASPGIAETYKRAGRRRDRTVSSLHVVIAQWLHAIMRAGVAAAASDLVASPLASLSTTGRFMISLGTTANGTISLAPAR